MSNREWWRCRARGVKLSEKQRINLEDCVFSYKDPDGGQSFECDGVLLARVLFREKDYMRRMKEEIENAKLFAESGPPIIAGPGRQNY